MGEEIDWFSVGLPLVTLEEVQQIDVTLREAKAVFTYQIGIKPFPSFASLPLGGSTDELRIIAQLNEDPFVSICIRGDGIEAQLHQKSPEHQLWFANFKCLLLARKAALAETSKPQAEIAKRLPIKVWLICQPDLERLAAAEPARRGTRMWLSTVLWGLLEPILVTKLAPTGSLPSAAKQFAEVGASLLSGSLPRG